MKTTLTVALATVVPGGLIILAGIFLWQMLVRRRGVAVARAVPVLAAANSPGRRAGWAASKLSVLARTM